MWFTSVNTASTDSNAGPKIIAELARQMGRLLRHPGYRRGNIVSALLLRHLPADSGYAWQGEDVVRERLTRAKLDPATLEHLRVGIQFEMDNLRKPPVR
jgi:hypothetical protein